MLDVPCYIIYLALFTTNDKDTTLQWRHKDHVSSPHKWPVTRKMVPFDDVIMHHQRMLYSG